MDLKNIDIFKWFKRTKPMRMLTDYERGWISAMISGEGSLQLNRKQDKAARHGYCYYPVLTIASTKKEIIDKVKAILQQGSIHFYKLKNKPHSKPFYGYALTGIALKTLLQQLTIEGKERQRVLLIEAFGHLYYIGNLEKKSMQRLDEIYEEMRKLNKRGR